MFNRLISFLLILTFSLPTFATVGENEPSAAHSIAVLNALAPESLHAELKQLEKKHNKIESWKGLKDAIDTLSIEDKAYLQTQLKDWEKTPFKRPTFNITETGFTLSAGEQKIVFNLQEGTLAAGTKSISLEGQTLKQVHQWLTHTSTTASLMSFIISDAHAIGPLAIILISFAITSAGILWNNSCRSAFSRVERRVTDLARTCSWDREQNRLSAETRDLMRDIGSTANQLLRVPRQTCEQQLRNSHRWLFFFSCAENASAICAKAAELSRCVTAIRARGAINDTELWREGPVQQPRRGRPSGAGGISN